MDDVLRARAQSLLVSLFVSDVRQETGPVSHLSSQRSITLQTKCKAHNRNRLQHPT